jgi:hypothetical protein
VAEAFVLETLRTARTKASPRGDASPASHRSTCWSACSASWSSGLAPIPAGSRTSSSGAPRRTPSRAPTSPGPPPCWPAGATCRASPSTGSAPPASTRWRRRPPGSAATTSNSSRRAGGERVPGADVLRRRAAVLRSGHRSHGGFGVYGYLGRPGSHARGLPAGLLRRNRGDLATFVLRYIYWAQGRVMWFVSLPVQVAMYSHAPLSGVAGRGRGGVGGGVRLRDRG